MQSMGQHSKDTAVLIFSLSAKREAERKQLFGYAKQQDTEQFFKILIRRTKAIASASNVDVFFINEQEQIGSNFGERYANAFQKIYDKGYNKIISIGNDTPELTLKALSTAIEAIQHNDVVVGPSTDGGVYLLGITRSAFNTDQFLNLPWLKDSLHKAIILSAFEQQKRIFSLVLLADIDDTSAMLHFAAATTDSLLANFIFNKFFASTRTPVSTTDTILSRPNASFLSLRGPPLYQIAC